MGVNIHDEGRGSHWIGLQRRLEDEKTQFWLLSVLLFLGPWALSCLVAVKSVSQLSCGEICADLTIK